MSFIDKKNRLFSLGQNRHGKTGLGKTIFNELKEIGDSDSDEKLVTDPISRQIFRSKRRSVHLAMGPDETQSLNIPMMVSPF